MVMAAVVVVGWVLDVRILKGFLPGLISMKINAALGLLLAGCGVLLASRPERAPARAALACAAAVFALGSLTGLEHSTGVDLGIDQALVRDTRDDGNPGVPGRMAPTTAFNFMLVGLSLLCLASSRRAFRATGQIAISVAGISSLVSTMAYLLEVTLPLPGYSQM